MKALKPNMLAQLARVRIARLADDWVPTPEEQRQIDSGEVTVVRIPGCPIVLIRQV